jgi:hypothetical protein
MISNCFVQDGQFNGTNGNITGDPKLTRWYYLDDGSPCISASGRTLAPGEDIGTTRVDGAADTGVADMGYHSKTGQIPGRDFYVDAVNGNNANTGLLPNDAFKSITHAFTQAEFGSTFFVAPGTYITPNETFSLIVPEGVSVIGSGFTNTFVRAMQNTSGFRVIRADGVTIEGFTISDAFNGDDSAGITINNAAPLIRNCRLTRNGARYTAGGVHITSGAPVIRNCIFDDNYSAWHNPPNILSPNGGVSLPANSANTVFENCLFTANRGYGVSMNGGTLRNCIITGNGDLGGLAPYDLLVAGVPVIENCNIGRHALPGTYTSVNSLDPDFSPKSTPEAPWQLSSRSPLVRKGKPLDWMAGATDILGNPRLFRNRVDLGPYQILVGDATLFLVR